MAMKSKTKTSKTATRLQTQTDLSGNATQKSPKR